MDLVIDANVVISCLISFSNKTSELFFSESFRLFAPEYLKAEIEKYKGEIMAKSSAVDVDLAFTVLCSRIIFIPFFDFEKYLPQAISVCPDPKDVEYFAVALKFGCPIWSNDKALKKQGEVKVFSTTELLQLS